MVEQLGFVEEAVGSLHLGEAGLAEVNEFPAERESDVVKLGDGFVCPGHGVQEVVVRESCGGRCGHDSQCDES